MINEEYSYKDFTHMRFTDRSLDEFNNSEIIGSCFYQANKLDVNIFPDGMTGVTFLQCNLDNVLFPPGNMIEKSCTNKRIARQNDGEDWILDPGDSPVSPVSIEFYIALGLDTDPAKIPVTPLPKSILAIKREQDAEDMKTEIPTTLADALVLIEKLRERA